MNIAVLRVAFFMINTVRREAYLLYEYCSTQTGGFVL
jgi:hypothetical protein